MTNDIRYLSDDEIDAVAGGNPLGAGIMLLGAVVLGVEMGLGVAVLGQVKKELEEGEGKDEAQTMAPGTDDNGNYVDENGNRVDGQGNPIGDGE